jgi:hypothetical protein
MLLSLPMESAQMEPFDELHPKRSVAARQGQRSKTTRKKAVNGIPTRNGKRG